MADELPDLNEVSDAVGRLVMSEVSMLEGVLALDKDLAAVPVLSLFRDTGEVLDVGEVLGGAMIHDLREPKEFECCRSKECV